MSKKGPRTEAFKIMTASLSEEIIAQYLEIARHVRDQELARQRERERRKEARKRARRAFLESLGLRPPKRKKKKKPKTKAGAGSKKASGGKTSRPKPEEPRRRSARPGVLASRRSRGP